ncbi:acetyltransferase, GNAT family [Gottschalkia acidurici 9a]|uniref:Acetyltransferase, GNAT family n=1 Tax=Gottschalkia acidurici (strain ATCC 7906 / DSM 604 / BCRC 14475 / CIP 104303 / KCTC 5404 / NCIMB 10678 / 9a) TaxID=1128398 RepID=K0AZR8_GOTA9|nr:N-acetyltransferase [Gottschalkia acidurici]AFS78215.1 acetyltransferase, GNAT family [Gottschalkia acidurici 9a]
MNIIIRQEEERDYSSVKYVVEKAFENAEYSDHKEQLLVERLRKSDAFIPELSLIAELNKEIIGHAMLTKLIIRNGKNEYESLALAPVSVLSQYQNIGIGSKLINESLKVAKQIGFKSVIVLGHEKYYPRFGFMPARTWGIKCPFEVPNESFMALELERDSLSDVDGTVIYPNEFFE